MLEERKNKFINRSNIIHNNLYDYSKIDYKNMNTKVDIVCQKHGVFQQIPNSHSRGQGCPKCGKIKNGANKTKRAKKEFIEKANLLHKNKYDYSLVEYKNSQTKVIIICPDHGEFKQKPNGHLSGQCVKCADANRTSVWSYSNWQKAGEKSKRFDSFKIYVIRCWNDEEEFYKIGKTFMKVKDRFKYQQIPYKYEIINILKGEAKAISELEKQLQLENKINKYVPKTTFSGANECFSKRPKLLK
jgi:hypothetical protein